MFVLAAIAIASSFWALLDFVNVLSKQVQSFGVASFETRFDGIRPALPRHGVYGYISDTPLNDEVTWQGEYYLTQYTLAPAIIKNSTTEPLVVANFHVEKPADDLLKDKHLVDVKDYGNDIHLYRYAPK